MGCSAAAQKNREADAPVWGVCLAVCLLLGTSAVNWNLFESCTAHAKNPESFDSGFLWWSIVHSS